MLIGLATSVLLHGMVLDLWRGATRLGDPVSGDWKGVPLHAKLQTPILERLPLEPVRQPAEQSSDAPSTPLRLPAATAGIADIRNVPAEKSSFGAVPLQEAAQERFTTGGLRPLSPAEGLVAYRLALLAELRPPSSGSLTNPLRIVLSWHDGAADLDVMRSSGDEAADQAWLSAMAHAVANAVLPSVLVGQVFSLDLEIEP